MSSFSIVPEISKWDIVNKERNVVHLLSEKFAKRAGMWTALVQHTKRFEVDLNSNPDMKEAVLNIRARIECALGARFTENKTSRTNDRMSKTPNQATSVVVPFVFVTALTLGIVSTIQKAYANHEPLDECRWQREANADHVRTFLEFVRKVDCTPEKYVFGFVFSTVDDDVTPVVSVAPENNQNNCEDDWDDARKQVTMVDMSDTNNNDPKPDDVEKHRDAALIAEAITHNNGSIMREVRKHLVNGNRGRLLLAKHSGRLQSSFQVLDDGLRALLHPRRRAPGDHTLKWIESSNLQTQLVVTVQDSLSLSAPGRTYKMLQPWLTKNASKKLDNTDNDDDDDDSDEAELCVVCKQRQRTHTIVPCGHINYCETCVDKLYECVVCQKHIVGRYRIFH